MVPAKAQGAHPRINVPFVAQQSHKRWRSKTGDLDRRQPLVLEEVTQSKVKIEYAHQHRSALKRANTKQMKMQALLGPWAK
jgi:hypothetical protein